MAPRTPAGRTRKTHARVPTDPPSLLQALGTDKGYLPLSTTDSPSSSEPASALSISTSTTPYPPGSAFPSSSSSYDDDDDDDDDEPTAGGTLSPSSQRIYADFTRKFLSPSKQSPESIVGPEDLSPRAVTLILIQLFTVTIFYGIDSTVVATLATPIASGFGELHRAAWLNSAYLLSVACCTPLYGRLSDIVGRRIAMGLGLSLFVFGSALCGLSRSMNVLIVARLVQGAGGGGSGMLGSIIISDIVPLRTRGLLNGVSSVCWATGAGFGGVYGGLVADALGWRWAFLLQLPPLMVIMAGLLYMVSYRVPGQNGSWKAVATRLDWTGSALLVVGIGSLVFSLAFKTNEGLPWSHPLVYLTLALSALALAAFVLVESLPSLAPEPVLSMRLLGNGSIACLAWSGFLMNGATISIGLFFPMLLQIVRGSSASVAGLHLMPTTIAGACGGVISGFYIRTKAKYFHLILILCVLQVLPCFFLAGVGRTTWEMLTWVVLMPQGFGGSGYNGSTFIALLSAVSRADTAIVTSIMFLFRACGQVIGMAVSSAIQQSVLEAELTKHISGSDAAAIVAEVRRNASSILDLPLEMRDSSIAAYATSLHSVFLANGCLAIAAAFLCIFIKEYPLSDTLADETKDAKMAKMESAYEDDAEMTAL